MKTQFLILTIFSSIQLTLQAQNLRNLNQISDSNNNLSNPDENISQSNSYYMDDSNSDQKNDKNVSFPIVTVILIILGCFLFLFLSVLATVLVKKYTMASDNEILSNELAKLKHSQQQFQQQKQNTDQQDGKKNFESQNNLMYPSSLYITSEPIQEEDAEQEDTERNDDTDRKQQFIFCKNKKIQKKTSIENQEQMIQDLQIKLNITFSSDSEQNSKDNSNKHSNLQGKEVLSLDIQKLEQEQEQQQKQNNSDNNNLLKNILKRNSSQQQYSSSEMIKNRSDRNIDSEEVIDSKDVISTEEEDVNNKQ